MHCHHEKTIVVDDRVAFVGGIDLTSEAGDRFDSSAHRARGQAGWHDLSAQVGGPAVADIAEHFRMRWREVTGEELASPAAVEPCGNVELQVVRTVPERIYTAKPHGDFRILESYVRALRRRGRQALSQRKMPRSHVFRWVVRVFRTQRLAVPPFWGTRLRPICVPSV